MARKIINLTLSYPHVDPLDATGKKPRYRVEKVGNTIEYVPHQYIDKHEADTLCHSGSFNVTMIPHREEA